MVADTFESHIFSFSILCFVFELYGFFKKVSACFLFVFTFKLMPLFLAPMFVLKDKILIFEFSFWKVFSLAGHWAREIP